MRAAGVRGRKGIAMRLRGKHGLTRTLRLSLLVTALMLALAAGVAQAGGASFEPGAPGLGDPYFPLDGNGGYDVKHYLLEITYDPATDVLTGKATISARAKSSLPAIANFIGGGTRKKLGAIRPP